MVHRWKETGEVSGPTSRLENALRKAIGTSGVDRLELWPAGGEHEQSVAVRVDGTREVWRNDDHKYDGLDGWITGTSDYYWRLVDGALWVDDLKTGKFYANPGPDSWGHDAGIEVGANRYPQDPNSAQIAVYALGIANLLGYIGPVLTSVTHWPRLPLVRRHAPPVRLWGGFSWVELEAFWAGLEQLYRDKKHNDAVLSDSRGGMKLNPGDQCRFCPARTNCLLAKDFS